jgi:hypothetical protein
VAAALEEVDLAVAVTGVAGALLLVNLLGRALDLVAVLRRLEP